MRRRVLALLLVGCSYDPQAVPSDGPPGSGEAVDVFEPTGCPGTYVAITGETSRYRLIDTARGFNAQHADCKSDGNHLVVYESVAERDAIRAQLSSDEVWVGAVQAPSQPAPLTGWSNLTGGGVLLALWESGSPNDSDDIESNSQNVAVDQSTGLDDKSQTETHRAICECDGHPIDSTVEAQIPQ